MPPRGFRHRHLPLFKTEKWDLGEFAAEIARYSLGEKTAFIDLLPSARNLVLADIAYALERGKVQSCVVLHVKPLNNGDNVDVQFLVEASFWSNEEPTAELKKFFSPNGNLIPCEYLFFVEGGKKVYLDDRYICPQTERHRLQIANPSCVFSDLIDFQVLPDENWFSRYSKYRQPFTWELLAVAWRYIAINSSHQAPSISALVEYLEGYLDLQGLEKERLPKRNKLYQIARNVRDQYTRSDLNSTVIVSSNPGRPQIAAANRKRVKRGLS